MFTGIIETTGIVTAIEISGSNHSFWVKSSLSQSLKVDQSVSHNGVCLTVEAINEGHHKVTAIYETLEKTELKYWKIGTFLNLERSLMLSDRLDGHLVQGHVDATGVCEAVVPMEGSWQYTVSFNEAFGHLVIEKGSICINGISLTAFNVTANTLTVAIIPFTYEHTNINVLKAGDLVNLEFDVLGKYLARWKDLSKL